MEVMEMTRMAICGLKGRVMIMKVLSSSKVYIVRRSLLSLIRSHKKARPKVKI